MRRVYIDVEKIPFDKPNMIKDIVIKLAQFINIEKFDNCAITKNIGSHHGGLSYHVYFPRRSTKDNIYNMIRQFKLKYPEFAEYIDETVYTKNRLFRLPNQQAVISNSIKNYPKDYNRQLDRHMIIHGNYIKTIIQNIKDLPYLKEFKPVLNEDLQNKHASKKGMSGAKIENIENKLNSLEDMVTKLSRLIEEKLSNPKPKQEPKPKDEPEYGVDLDNF